MQNPEDQSTPPGAPIGALSDAPELAVIWEILSDDQRRKILDILKAQRTPTAERQSVVRFLVRLRPGGWELVLIGSAGE